MDIREIAANILQKDYTKDEMEADFRKTFEMLKTLGKNVEIQVVRALVEKAQDLVEGCLKGQGWRKTGQELFDKLLAAEQHFGAGTLWKNGTDLALSKRKRADPPSDTADQPSDKKLKSEDPALADDHVAEPAKDAYIDDLAQNVSSATAKFADESRTMSRVMFRTLTIMCQVCLPKVTRDLFYSRSVATIPREMSAENF
jgi:hypothetical protein